MQPTELITTTHRRHPWRRLLLVVLATLILTLIFAAYLQPAFMLDLANRFILCL